MWTWNDRPRSSSNASSSDRSGTAITHQASSREQSRDTAFAEDLLRNRPRTLLRSLVHHELRVSIRATSYSDIPLTLREVLPRERLERLVVSLRQSAQRLAPSADRQVPSLRVKPRQLFARKRRPCRLRSHHPRRLHRTHFMRLDPLLDSLDHVRH